jgi:hypothetical protein
MQTATKPPSKAVTPETSPATTPAAAPEAPKRLEGQALLAYVDDNIELSKAALAKGSGYYRQIPKDDAPGEFRTQVLVEQFYDALLAAQGINLKKRASAGKSVAYQTSVHNNGVALIGKNYIEEMKCYPGDTLNIVVEDGKLTLSVAARGPGIPAPEPKKKEKAAPAKAATDGSQL